MDGFEALALILAVVVIGLLLWVRALAGRIARLERGFEFGTGSSRSRAVASSTASGTAAGSTGEAPNAEGGSVVSTPGHPSPAVLGYLAAGEKIGAIKQYRIETGVGLREAKDAVEAYERQDFGVNV